MRGSRVLRPVEVFMEKQKELSSQRMRWLFENHVEFLSTHRGNVTRLKDAFTVESDRPEFTYAVLGSGENSALLEKFSTVHLIQWNDPREQDLNDPRYQSRGGLSYMTFAGDSAAWTRNPSVEIVSVTTKEEMDIFSHVQAAGFAQTQEDYDRWHPWLSQANHRNLNSERQKFYVGYVDGKPVGTTLLVLTKGLAGIYAVATLPESRKRGIGSSLMARAVTDARNQQCDLITLQVAASSYAESLYKKLGFDTRFSAKIFAH